MPSSIPPSTPGKVWQPPSPHDLASELPAYEILGLLGRGGMGAVYKARQKSLNREVAIKVLPPMVEEDGSMQYAERFKSEAQSMARLNHPDIVAVYDAGETPGGLLYFVMEMVQGTDVAQMIAASGRLPPEHAYAIVAHVCDALAYAHGNGIIHRDIKPANIMVDMEGRVKVADFGLAKAVDANSGFTQSNMAVGTPDFVAPEALIPGMPLDARADLYAVGVMLHQMLTGQIPRGAFKPASVIVPGIDARFDQIILKAMQYDREERHHSALELRQHLDTLLMPATPVMPVPNLQRYSSAGMAKVAAAPPERKTSFPTRSPAAGGAAAQAKPADKNVRSTSAPPPPAKSKTPLLIGLGAAAAIGIGAFVMLRSGKREFSDERPPISASTSASEPGTLTSSATGNPSAKVAGPPKTEPKPVVVAKAPEAPQPEPAKPAMADASSGKREFSDERPRASTSAPAPKPGTLTSSATAPAASISSSPSLPPELAALDAQFIALQKERVTTPYESGLSKLNSSYLGGIDKAIASEKAAGHLDAILALEAEKKLIQGAGASGPLAGSETPPPSDDAKTPESLKNLRAIWRAEHAKLLSARAAMLKALVDPLGRRLAQMETNFTKADRLADAKTVRGYREVLGESSPGLQPASPAMAAKAPETPSTPGSGLKPPTTLNPAATLALKDGFTNTLGMKFLPVKGTEVMFCIHETRRQDYAAYANEVPDVDGAWKNQQRDGIPCGDKDNHPVVGVSWEDAVKFCEWLSKKEGKLYRLPTDEEWSIAVNLGGKEKRGKGITPGMLNGKETTEYPWGDDYPPMTKDKAGNYADESWHEKFPTKPWIEKYRDGFPTTAPVMSFKPNKLGLYDLGGNVWEWCEDWYDNAQKDRVLRGASFVHDRAHLLASRRFHYTPGYRYCSCGFRVVMVVSTSGR